MRRLFQEEHKRHNLTFEKNTFQGVFSKVGLCHLFIS